MIAAVGDPVALYVTAREPYPAHRVALLHRSTSPTAGHSFSVPEVGHGRSSSRSLLAHGPFRLGSCRRQDSNLLSAWQRVYSPPHLSHGGAPAHRLGR